MITPQDANLAALVLKEVAAKLRAQAMDDKATRLEKVAEALMTDDTIIVSEATARS